MLTALSGVALTFFIIPVDLSTSGDDLRIFLPLLPNRVLLYGSLFLLLLFLKIERFLPTSSLSDCVIPVGCPSSGVGGGDSVGASGIGVILKLPDTT